jgi:hypothetical protein
VDHAPRTHAQSPRARALHAHSDFLQRVRHDAYIADIGHVLNKRFALCEKGARHHRKRRVLAPAGCYAARQARAAGNNQFHPI